MLRSPSTTFWYPFRITQGRSVSQPIVVFTSVWLAVLLLYQAKLSGLLVYPNAFARQAVGMIVTPFVLTGVVVLCVRKLLLSSTNTPAVPPQIHRQVDVAKVSRRLNLCFLIWSALTLIEIAYSRGLPIVWELTGGSQTYFDFGIPSAHGFLNSMLQAISLVGFCLFLLTGRRGYLGYPTFLLVWSVLLVTRHMMIVNLLELAVLFVLLRPLRPAVWLVLGVSAVVVICAFGVIGDLRSGADHFYRLAVPSQAYPHWLPSGFLWVYLYLTSPLNNLIHTIQLLPPVHDPAFSNTFASLFPSVLRLSVVDPDTAARGVLFTEAFNVSTAYVGPYQDMGYRGIILYSVMTSLLCHYFWLKRNITGTLVYCVLAACLVLSVFYHAMFNLPVIFQVVWIYLLFNRAAYRCVVTPEHFLPSRLSKTRRLVTAPA